MQLTGHKTAASNTQLRSMIDSRMMDPVVDQSTPMSAVSKACGASDSTANRGFASTLQPRPPTATVIMETL